MRLKHNKLKLVLFFSTLFFVTKLVAQNRFAFGLKSNLGFYGIESSLLRKSETNNGRQSNLFIAIPKARYSFKGLLRYTFFRENQVRLSIQVEAGYTYSYFRKEWHFRTGYDEFSNNYTTDVRIIHELQSHQLVLPVIGQLHFRNWIGGLGFIRSRYLSAKANRTKQRLTPLTSGGWSYELAEWKASETADLDNLKDNTAYLNQRRNTQIVMNLQYQLKENIILGIEATKDIESVFIQTYSNQVLAHGFYFDTQSISLSVCMLH